MHTLEADPRVAHPAPASAHVCFAAGCAQGIAGTPVSSIEICLHSEPEITDSNGTPYLTTDTVHADGTACAGRGEVWLRGTNVTAGYYKAPELTKGEFRSDGFFMTGE